VNYKDYPWKAAATSRQNPSFSPGLKGVYILSRSPPSACNEIGGLQPLSAFWWNVNEQQEAASRQHPVVLDWRAKQELKLIRGNDTFWQFSICF